MESGFWHKCWEKNSLGFHQYEAHPFLTKYFPSLLKEGDHHVFVPLCGKSLDMVHLAKHMKVTGNELSAIACRDFFLDNNVDFKQSNIEGFTRYSYENITLLEGDFFSLPPTHFTSLDWIYDRAALIALPQAMQEQYARKLKRFLSVNTRLFLLTIEFPEAQLTGPPFPITASKVEQLFDGCDIKLIDSHELADKQFAQRIFDVDYLIEKAYIITLRN